MPSVYIDVEVCSEQVMHMVNEEEIVQYLVDTYPQHYWRLVMSLCPYDVTDFLSGLEGYLREWTSEDLETLKQLVAKIETKNKEVSDVA